MNPDPSLLRWSRLIRAGLLLTVFVFSSVLCGCAGLTAEPESREAPSIELVVHHHDGRVTLNSYLPEHLVLHMRNCMVNGERELLFEQILSDELKKRYENEGRDPQEAIDWIMGNQRDILILLNRLDRGLQSQYTKWEQRGSTLRLQIYGLPAQDLRFRTLDLIREKGQYRFLLVK